jgi:hypothetical protein
VVGLGDQGRGEVAVDDDGHRVATVPRRSGRKCHSDQVQVSVSDIARIPPGNLRVPREEFVAVWSEAARRGDELGDRGVTDWYLGGVAVTCRWLAAAPSRTARGGGLMRSPATRRSVVAYEELIEAEYLAAQTLEQRRPELAAREGWCEAVRATLSWAWRREGPPPVEVPASPVSG